MIRRLYDWTLGLAARRNAEWVLAGVSFAESSFFPIPPDAMMVPMVLARPERAWRLAFIATLASVVGGLFGYAIGYYLLETVGAWIINLYGLTDKLDQFQAAYARWGVWIILIKGLTPIPYKLVTIASGIAHFSLPWFILASCITRALRFFIVAALLKFYGPPIRTFIEARLTLVTTVFALLIVVGFVSLRYL
ncbi:membrane protein YqaA, SNARE-associated domain [Arboricoccus pini]|uniref:Membrane protein YqaA, SNARE-associated domain n=1 Tax=Arboricoccus pini TaxID=1963835 RepID=A0A212QRY1_9PROT|nr:YqaA family protein [Arboricoccus pini]SNB62179.1 membrane protein YqaA, SNARE-associated domain [Arboricoccus pini]